MRHIIGALIVVLAIVPDALGGNLAPPGAPEPTMKTMQEVYDQIAQANRAAGGGDALLLFPHIIEQQGTISNTQYTFDTTFYVVATGPYVGTGLKQGTASKSTRSVGDVTIRLYLYDSLGQPAVSATAAQVAYPAEFTIGYSKRRTTISLDSLFQIAGGFPSSVFTGFAILSINSGDWNDAAIQAFTLNSRTSAFDLSITPLEPVRVQNTAAAEARKSASEEAVQ